jgi:hypothetical protein
MEYEYKVVHAKVGYVTTAWEKALNDEAKDGWRLHTVLGPSILSTSKTMIVFERETKE